MKALIAAALLAAPIAAPALASPPAVRPDPVEGRGQAPGFDTLGPGGGGQHTTIAAARIAPASASGPQAPSTGSPQSDALRRGPKLVVVISVDQFSADLFQQYRNHFTDGFARLLAGAVFPAGYQGHAATETCPGHSTILTGMRPAHTGIVANNWIDQSIARDDKTVYCAEDETAPGTDHSGYYVVSDHRLKVPTLAGMMKRADLASRTVSVAGKDRAAVMMGGARAQLDQIWWWQDQKKRPDKTFVTYPDRAEPAVVSRAKAAVAALLAKPQAALPLPAWCTPLDRAVQAGTVTVGRGRFERAAGDATAFKASPAFDAAVLSLAAGLIQDMRLGRGPATDIIDIGASATDYIGHAYGTQGTEMCIQMDQLDQSLGAFFATLDGWGLDYEVVLTADHGGHDMVERQQQRAMPMEAHVRGDASIKAVGAAIAAELKLAANPLISAEGDIYVDRTLPAATRAKVLARAQAIYASLPQVAAAFPRTTIAAQPLPTGSPETWTLLERARTSFDPGRSGDLLILLKPRVTTIETPTPGYVETHGSPWDYDRRVPILFWRRGMTPFEQPLPVETVDIVPTLAATIGLPVHGLDGRCLDLDPGAGTTCP